MKRLLLISHIVQPCFARCEKTCLWLRWVCMKNYNPTSRPVGRDGWNRSAVSCHYRDTPDMVMSLERHTQGRIMDKAD